MAGLPTGYAPNDLDYSGYQKDLPLIGMPGAWKITTGSSSVVVAILDTGVQPTHPDLAPVDWVSPYNELAPASAPLDGHGHGTHVTGTIAAETNNGIGIAGIAPGVFDHASQGLGRQRLRLLVGLHQWP